MVLKKRSHFMLAAALAITVGSTANAASLAGSMAKEPEFERSSSRGLYDVERCIVFGKYNDTPSVYRTPDRPEESVIYYPGAIAVGAVVALDRQGSALRVRFWNAGGQLQKLVESCL